MKKLVNISLVAVLGLSLIGCNDNDKKQKTKKVLSEYQKGYQSGLNALVNDTQYYKDIMKESIVKYNTASGGIDKAVALRVLNTGIKASCERIAYNKGLISAKASIKYKNGFMDGCIKGFNVANYQ